MAGEVVDYMIGILVVSMIFVSAVLVVPNMSYVNLLYVDQQQLRNVALDAMKTMLFEPGYPGDWGSTLNSPEDLQRFGLASQEMESFYMLDPNKIKRLNEKHQNPYWNCLEYDRVRDLLGLESYGFSLSILPPFNVTISDQYFDTEQPSVSFKVKVLRHDGRPVANAAVDTTIICSTQDGITTSPTTTTFTDLLGTCEVYKTWEPDGNIKDLVAVLKVSVADIATVIDIYQRENVAEIIKIGYTPDENVTLSIPEEEYPFDQPNEANWVSNVAGYYGPGDVDDLYSGGKVSTDGITWGEGYKSWSRNIPGIQSSDPSLVILVVSCVPKGEGGRTPLLIVDPGPNYIEPEGFHFGGTPPQGTAVSVWRNVVVSGTTYLVEMTLWKERL